MVGIFDFGCFPAVAGHAYAWIFAIDPAFAGHAYAWIAHAKDAKDADPPSLGLGKPR